MSLKRLLCSAVIAAGILYAAPVQGSERSYHSDNADVETILTHYWDEKASENPKCGKGEPLRVEDERKKIKYSVLVETFCFGGGNPEYRLKIVRNSNGVRQTFLDAVVDGELDNRSPFSSISDKYLVKTKKGTNEYDFSMPEDISQKDQAYMRKQYEIARKELAGILRARQKK